MSPRLEITQEAIESLSQKDPRLGSFIAKTGVLSRELTPDPYLATLDCIIAQQVSAKAATSISNRFFERYPGADPKAILEDSIENLRSCGLSGSKANYLRGIAQARLDQTIDFDNLHNLSTQEVMDTLLPLKGVGRWTVEMVLIFSLAKMDVMSYDDLAIIRGIMRLYDLDEVSREFFDRLYETYAPYQTYASLYLWAASLSKEAIPYP